MQHQVAIIIMGICLLTDMTVGNQTVKRVILPQLLKEQDPRIGVHKAFVAFPSGAGDGASDWSPGGELSTKLTEGIPYSWYQLDGDEVAISLTPEPFSVHPSFASTAVRLYQMCHAFTALSPDYAFGTDLELKAGQIDLNRGVLYTQYEFVGMLAARLLAHAEGSVTITARSWKTGRTRSVRVKEGADIWIGNMEEAFFANDADPSAPEHPGMNHFLAYYRMSATPNHCDWHPVEEASGAAEASVPAAVSGVGSGGTRAAHARPNIASTPCVPARKLEQPEKQQEKKPAPVDSEKPGKNFGVSCSPSNYP
jgi:hypothetical protein